ncbi:hypothetical protein ACJMK2_011300 [Sinanodonta woodiana]|uniref:C1q domain-containing protein n=1 Tax=Sinanodonta woodiana TaxID=1069815 RepID=A0ABD3V4K5_SINWO
MTPIFFALYFIFICCTFSRTQSTATILQETMGSDFIKFVHEMSSELNKLKEEHIELKRIVQRFVGNQEANDQVLVSDLKKKMNDSVEQLDESKTDSKMIHNIRKDLSSIQEKLKLIQNEQGMTRVLRKKILMAVKELKLFEREGKNIQLKGHLDKGFRRLRDESVLITDSATNRKDIKANERDLKYETKKVVGYDDINESEDQIGKTRSFDKEDAIDRRHGRKNNITNKKESMIGIVQSKRTDGKHYVRDDNKKEMIRKSASMYSAFTARFYNDLRQFAIGKPIVFNDVYLNLGNGYDGNSGIFRTPVAGLYLVMMTISSSESNTPDVEVVKNGSPLCRVVAWTSSANSVISIGSPCNVLVQLNVGDDVWARDLLHKEGYVIRGQYYSTFSMALLVPDPASGSSS